MAEKNDLTKHTYAAFHDKEIPFECNICDAKFAEKHGLSRHIAVIHKEKRPFECKICGAKFAEIGTLTTHIRSLHDGKKPYKCSICDKRAHVKTHIASIHKRQATNSNVMNLNKDGRQNKILVDC